MNRFFISVFVLLSFLFAEEATSSSQKTARAQYNINPEMLAVLHSNSDPWFSEDKFYHLTVCAAIPPLTFHLCTNYGNIEVTRAKVYSVSATALIGISKEIYDKKKKNHFSWKDLFWDGVGLTIGYFLFIN